MDRKTFLTLIPFLPALLKLKRGMHSNQVHIDAIKREAANLRAIAELTKIQQEKEITREEWRKLAGV